ncbi:hypothetical protein BH10BAC3_BH10BAC3_01510 [soil metagenome]
MSIQQHYLQTAGQLLASYKGDTPLHLYLKQFFGLHKKYGSRDRKNISSLCYSYFRLGKALPNFKIQDKILLALYLINNQPTALLEILNKLFNEHVTKSFGDKLVFADVSILPQQIFPSYTRLSGEINVEDYAAHMLIQPDVFVRVRPGKSEIVERKLRELEWNYVREPKGAIRLEPGASVDKHFKINEELVIQDLNSQKVGEIVQEVFRKNSFIPSHLWDCCAASGGKSIMMKDLFPAIKITVSDIRLSILQNLAKRFKEAGINTYHKFVADLVVNKPALQLKPTNFIITDVPCTGSGTWSRTPEQLYFFKEEVIEEYAAKQFAIAKNAINYLLPGGWLAYITCSVFKKENESIVAKLLADNSMQLVHQELLNGTRQKADSMFVAIMRKS